MIKLLKKEVCKNLADSRLGVKDLELANRTFLKKYAWDFLAQDSWGAKFS